MTLDAIEETPIRSIVLADGCRPRNVGTWRDGLPNLVSAVCRLNKERGELKNAERSKFKATMMPNLCQATEAVFTLGYEWITPDGRWPIEKNRVS